MLMLSIRCGDVDECASRSAVLVSPWIPVVLRVLRDKIPACRKTHDLSREAGSHMRHADPLGLLKPGVISKAVLSRSTLENHGGSGIGDGGWWPGIAGRKACMLIC
jgi:hypothetical protein